MLRPADGPGEQRRPDTPTEDGDPRATRPQPMGEPLAKGDRVGRFVIDHYEGAGSYGRVYAAYDSRDEKRNVVVKALRSEAPYARHASEQERRALRDVLGHAQIVQMLDWVDGGPRGKDDAAFYLILEHLNGAALDEEIEGARDPLTAAVMHERVPHLVRRVLGVLDAVSEMHRRGHAFNDFKPAHIKTHRRANGDVHVKLIDFGAVAPFGPRGDAPIFAPATFRDPRLRVDGPSAASDIYAIGRTVMVAATGLDPDASARTVRAAPVFAAAPALLRLIERATEPDPADRFSSVAELEGALTTVLHQLDAVLTDGVRAGRPPPRSVHFVSRDADFGTRPPIARLDVARRAAVERITAAELLARLPRPDDEALTESGDPTRQMVGLRSRFVSEHLDRGHDAEADTEIEALAAADPTGWRAPWYRAVVALRTGAPEDAGKHLDVVADHLPGEPVPELALAAVAEILGDDDRAERLYRIVARTDPRHAAASFGLARMQLRAGLGVDAAATLLAVTRTRSHGAACLGAARALLDERPVASIPVEHFVRAQEALEADDDAPAGRPEIRAEFLLVAWEWCEQHGHTRDPGGSFLGVPLATGPVRDALSVELRALARRTGGAAHDELVDLANSVRRPTWW